MRVATAVQVMRFLDSRAWLRGYIPGCEKSLDLYAEGWRVFCTYNKLKIKNNKKTELLFPGGGWNSWNSA